ncbi:MAG: hypothetical protein IJY82_00270 [Oscillospiraceae bacterium]|nr:hypothetical protein [Oscillospiraceae bacterium]
MFGYVTPFKPELKIREYETYQAVYCGLCRQLGRVFGFLGRATLSYDFTFLALMQLGLSDRCTGFTKCHCFLCPAKKVGRCADGDALTYPASAAMLMLCHKLRDDLSDQRGLKKLPPALLLPFAKRHAKKAARLYPALAAELECHLSRQREIEASNPSADLAADPSAQAVAALFEQIGTFGEEKRTLRRLGYLLGRWIYFMDAADDLEKDLRSGSFNPLALRAGLSVGASPQELAAVRKEAEATLNLTAGEISNLFEELELKRFKPILANCIYLGLPARKDEVLQNKKRGAKHDRSI